VKGATSDATGTLATTVSTKHALKEGGGVGSGVGGRVGSGVGFAVGSGVG
jgi:hypothetical protein